MTGYKVTERQYSNFFIATVIELRHKGMNYSEIGRILQTPNETIGYLYRKHYEGQCRGTVITLTFQSKLNGREENEAGK